MKIVRFEHSGAEGVGVMTEDEKVLPLPWRTLGELYAEPDVVAGLAGVQLDPSAAVRPDRLLAPVPYRGTVIGTGGNYADHAAEARANLTVKEPVFISYLWSAVIGPGADIVIPTPDTFTDYEVEMAVVIGKRARHLTPEDAMEHVLGYTVVNDVSARDVMVRELMQVMLCKSPDTFLPVGPTIVTKDEIPDPYALKICTRLNGELRQSSNTGNMTTRIPALLVALTRYVTLFPGDIVTTGTPGGVGYFRDPPEQMRPGDVITAEVEGLGSLTNSVIR